MTQPHLDTLINRINTQDLIEQASSNLTLDAIAMGYKHWAHPAQALLALAVNIGEVLNETLLSEWQAWYGTVADELEERTHREAA